ncbi:MAG: NUDIX domain-containing protein [Methylophaga sp.]|nr:NUDIX domain-containing protein [Methylophaga sp.]
MTQKKQFKIIKQTPEYQGFFSLKTVTVSHTLYQGGWSEPLSRELFERGNCVAVLLYDPLRDEVVIIEQFRVGALQLNDERAWLLEIVAGTIEPGETAAEVAMREAVEEAGCEIVELIKVMDFFTSPGGTSELLTLFCGRVDTSQVGGVHGLDEEDEDIAVTALPYAEVCQLFNDGKILSAIPIIAIQWLMLNRDMLRKQWT